MAKTRKTGGRLKGTPNKATAGVKELLGELLPDRENKKLWKKWLNHKNPRVAFEAFKLALSYMFGKPVQPTVGDELSPRVLIIDMSNFPERKRATCEQSGTTERSLRPAS